MNVITIFPAYGDIVSRSKRMNVKFSGIIFGNVLGKVT